MPFRHSPGAQKMIAVREPLLQEKERAYKARLRNFGINNYRINKLIFIQFAIQKGDLLTASDEKIRYTESWKARNEGRISESTEGTEKAENVRAEMNCMRIIAVANRSCKRKWRAYRDWSD